MKTILTGLLIGGLALPTMAQTLAPNLPGPPTPPDSVNRGFSPNAGTLRMGTDFYHRPGDLPLTRRATLDNMVVRAPDPSQVYFMPNPHLANNRNRYQLPLPENLRLQPYRPHR